MVGSFEPIAVVVPKKKRTDEFRDSKPELLSIGPYKAHTVKSNIHPFRLSTSRNLSDNDPAMLLAAAPPEVVDGPVVDSKEGSLLPKTPVVTSVEIRFSTRTSAFQISHRPQMKSIFGLGTIDYF